MSRTQTSVKLLSLVVAAGSASSVAHAQSWANPVSGNWFDASMWNPMSAPSGAGASATLGLSGTYRVLTPSNTMLNVNITNPQASLDIAPGTQLIFAGGAVNTLNGQIVVNPNASYNGTGISVNAANVTFSGTGSIRLNSSESDPNTTINTAYITAAAEGSMVMNSGTTLGGFGHVVNVPTTNRGTFTADVSGRPLRVEGSTHANESLYTAANGGLLQLIGMTVNQTGAGRIAPAAGSTVHLYSTYLNGGAVTSLPTGRVQMIAGTGGLANVTVTGGLDVGGGTSTLIGAGGLTLVGGATVLLNTNADYAGTPFSMGVAGTPITGNGTLRLNASASDPGTTVGTATINAANGTASMLVGSGVNLAGFGMVIAPSTNNGVYNADMAGRPLRLDGASHQNNGQYRATGGGALVLVNTSVTQAPGSGITATGASGDGTINSNVQFHNVSLTGGSVTSTGLARVQLNPSASATMTGVAINGGFDVYGGSNLYVNSPGITLNGGATLLVNTAGNYAATRLATGDAATAVNGNGTVRLNGSDSDPTTTVYTAAISEDGGAPGGSFVFASGISVAGFGIVGNVPTTNNGVFNADISGRVLRVDSNAHQNNNIYRASNGGTLVLVGTTVSQSPSAAIRAENGSTVVMSNSRVNGGTVGSPAGGSGVTVMDNTLVTLDGVNVSRQFSVNGSGALAAPSSLFLSNNAVITINTNADYAVTRLRADGAPTQLNGTGTIRLNASESDPTTTVATADMNRNGDVPGSGFTFGSGITVDGFGRIFDCPTTNNGVVTANRSGGRVLRIEGNTHQNNNRYSSSNGGTLVTVNTTVNQSGAGVIDAGDTSSVVLHGTTINGGSLTAGGSGRFAIGATTTLGGVTSSAPIDIGGSQALAVSGAGITNNGLITVNTNADYAVTHLRSVAPGAAINGNGEVRLKRSGSDGSATIGTADMVSGATDATFVFGAGQKLTGSGAIRLPVTMSGRLAPGVGAGGVDFIRNAGPGTLAFTNSGVMEIDILSTSTFDRIVNDATLALDGTLRVTSAGDAAPGTTYDIVTGGTITGGFDQVLSFGLNAPKRFGAAVTPGRVRVTVLCGLADVGSAGADSNGDGMLDNNDFIVFINRFFDQDPGVDFGQAGGEQGSDGLFDNNDFIAFIDLFFAGCF